MSENITKEQENACPSEERVIAKLNTLRVEISARFDQLYARLQVLEAKNFDTKPMWERALAEVVELRGEVRDLATKTERAYERLEDKLEIFNKTCSTCAVASDVRVVMKTLH